MVEQLDDHVYHKILSMWQLVPMRSWKDVKRHEALNMGDSVGERLHLVFILVAYLHW